jgi:hypothetical protein
MLAKIVGYVVSIEGNFMPGSDRQNRIVTHLSGIPVYILKGKHRPFKTIKDRTDLALELTLFTDENGRFECELKSGIYTIVAEINGQLYLNNYSKDGYWYYVILGKSETLTFNIIDSTKAAY